MDRGHGQVRTCPYEWLSPSSRKRKLNPYVWIPSLAGKTHVAEVACMDDRTLGGTVYSRRNVLGKMFLGAMALVGAVPLIKSFYRSGAGTASADDEFPPEGSIFHPKQDPRNDPRRG